MYVVCYYFFLFFPQKSLWRYLCSLSSAAGLTLTFPLFIVLLCVSCSFCYSHLDAVASTKASSCFFSEEQYKATAPSAATSLCKNLSQATQMLMFQEVSLFSHCLVPEKIWGYCAAARAKRAWDPSYKDDRESQMPACCRVSKGCTCCSMLCSMLYLLNAQGTPKSTQGSLFALRRGAGPSDSCSMHGA